MSLNKGLNNRECRPEKKEGNINMKTIMTISMAILMIAASAGRLMAENNAAGTTVKSRRAQQKAERKAHFHKQKQENKEFRQSTRELKGKEKADAIVQNRETQYRENKAFIQQQHDENMAFLNESLAKNTKLTDTQKTDLTTFFESQYQENVSFRDKQHSENIGYFKSVANDSTLTMEQKKAKIKKYFAAQKANIKGYMQQQKSERKAKRNKCTADK